MTTMGQRKCGQTRIQLIGVLVLFWLYLVLGAFIFGAIERPHAVDLHHDFVVAQAAFLSNNSCVNEIDLQQYSNVLIDIYSGGLEWNEETGFDTDESHGYQSNHWDFMDSLFFSATVVTTIGYGHLSPSTTMGRSVCIAYALVGIPLSGLLVTIIGQQLKKRLSKLWKRLLGKLYCVTSATSSTARHVALFTSVMAAGIFFYVLLIILPAFCFFYIEGWDWMTSHYYSFISFTTIGFGDYVAGDNPTLSTVGRIVYKIVLIFYLVFGMGFVTLLLHTIQQQNTDRVRRLAKRKPIRRILKKRRGMRKLDEHDGAISKMESPEDDEYIVITDIFDGDQIEMSDLDEEMEYETISICEVAVQTSRTQYSTKSTQTERTDVCHSLNDNNPTVLTVNVRRKENPRKAIHRQQRQLIHLENGV